MFITMCGQGSGKQYTTLIGCHNLATTLIFSYGIETTEIGIMITFKTAWYNIIRFY